MKALWTQRFLMRENSAAPSRSLWRGGWHLQCCSEKPASAAETVDEIMDSAGAPINTASSLLDLVKRKPRRSVFRRFQKRQVDQERRGGAA